LGPKIDGVSDTKLFTEYKNYIRKLKDPPRTKEQTIKLYEIWKKDYLENNIDVLA
jgi:hypothetical protein